MIAALRKVWRRSRIFNYGFVERDLWIAREAARVPAGSRVLDVGAGVAPYRPLFAHCEYRTTDACPLQPHQNRGGQPYGQIDYVCDVTAIPVPDASFDVVICTEVLEHVPEPIKAIQEFGRIVRPGGLLLLSAPLSGYVHQEPYHFYGGFSPYFYQKFLSENGFTDIQVMQNGGFFRHYGAQSVRLVNCLKPSVLTRNPLLQVLLYPLWIPLVLYLGILTPLIMHVLDPLDRSNMATAGYHVRARKCAS
ncbi:MAG: class I SAM-dependent methyltransferase [Chloroherpetonaceae bacterium]|nr:class I SAM-dependent methyltransferase [Chthonomonadaceae bacterium]MDW8209090.1 class I SAM-dependent methyltransferase [Chloroherpetonaceae bacterium]